MTPLGINAAKTGHWTVAPSYKASALGLRGSITRKCVELVLYRNIVDSQSINGYEVVSERDLLPHRAHTEGVSMWAVLNDESRRLGIKLSPWFDRRGRQFLIDSVQGDSNKIAWSQIRHSLLKFFAPSVAGLFESQESQDQLTKKAPTVKLRKLDICLYITDQN